MTAVIVLILAFFLPALSADAADWSCLNPERTGWTGFMCGNDVNHNGQIDDCSEMLTCSRKSFGECVKGDTPFAYQCIKPGGQVVDCGFAGAECPACNAEYDYVNDVYLSEAGTVTPLYMYTCTRDGSQYLGSTACQTACGAECMCPQGGLWNRTTQQCEVLASVQCSEGYVYDFSEHLCIQEVQCPPGTHLDPGDNRCVTDTTYICPDVFLYSSATGKCQRIPDCMGSGLFNAVTGKCEQPPNITCQPGYAYDAQSRQCESQPDCGLGTYNASLDVCEMPASASCQTGYSYNSLSQSCEATPACGPGGSYISAADRCEATPGITCPPGYTYESASGQCQTGPGCPAGGTYSAGSDRCETTSSPVCPAPYVYNSVTESCETAPQCAMGTYNGATNLCELSVSPTCNTPYSLWYATASDYRCAATVSCPAGTYNVSSNKCEVAGTAQCSPGYIFNATLGLCESAPVCTSPGLYDAVDNRCEATSSVTCQAPYVLNVSTSQCEANPICAAPGAYDTVDNRCEAALSMNYTCSLNGLQYSSYSACSSACVNSAFCTLSTTQQSVSISAPWVIMYDDFNCSMASAFNGVGDTIEIYDWANGDCSGPYITGTITVPGATFSGVIGFRQSRDDGYITVYPDRICNRDGQCLYASGVSMSGTIKCPNWAQPCYVAQSSTTGELCIQSWYSGCDKLDGDRLNFSQSVTTYVCPLGGYACSGSPAQCQQYGSCTSVSTCPSGYGNYGSFCAANASCPPTGWLNSGTDKCNMSPTTSCPPGYVNSGGVCQTAATCLYGGSLNGAYDTCQLPATYGCPGGFIWNGSTCQRDPDCPLMGTTTGTFNPSYDLCEVVLAYSCPSGMTYSAVSGKCERSSTCPAPGALNTSVDQCLAPVNYNCPIGYTYAGGGVCAAPANCPAGGSLNPATDSCSASAVYNCPAGYSYVSGTCQANAICPPGGILDGATDLCSSSPSYSCPVGWTWDSASMTCRKPADCPAGGSLSPSGDVCVSSATYTCEPGYSLNAATLLCESDPQCPAGSTFNSATTMCEMDPEVLCPPGTVYSLTTGRCESTPVCDPPGSYNPILQKCSDPGTPDCPPDYVFDAAERLCEATPVCTPSDWVCPTNAADPVCNGTATVMNRAYKEVGTASNDIVTGELIVPPSYTFATTTAPLSMPGFESVALQYGAHPADYAHREFILEKYGKGPFWIANGVLYHDVFFDFRSCQPFIDTAGRTWRPRSYASAGCSYAPWQWEKIEDSCLCTKYEETTYERTCTVDAPFYAETRSTALTFDTDMSTCTGNHLFCSAGLQQQGLNDCQRNETLYEDFITCNGVTVEKFRKTVVCLESAPVTVPTEYRDIPFFLFGVMQWDERKCNPCMTSDNSVVTDDLPSGPEPPIDQAHTCTNFRMFSGMVKRCRPSGFNTIFSNCCDLSGWFKSWCRNDERELKKRRQAGTCHEVGTYCSSRMRLIGTCFQRTKSYCCFNSKLSRILQEQGRLQISKPWGSPRSPDCRGYSPDDFSRLDFSTIDLSEYVNDITVDMSQSPSNVMKGVQDWMTRQSNRSFLNSDK